MRRAAESGRLMTRAVPQGARGCSRTVPLRRRTVSATTDRPMPRPDRVSTAALVEKPGSNTRARSASRVGGLRREQAAPAGRRRDGGEVGPGPSSVTVTTSRPPFTATSRPTRQRRRLARPPAHLRRLRAVAQGVAQGMQDGVLERLQHGPVHRNIEAGGRHLDLRAGLTGHVAQDAGEAAEHRLGRDQGEALGLVAHPGGGRVHGGGDDAAPAGEAGGVTRQGEQAAFQGREFGKAPSSRPFASIGAGSQGRAGGRAEALGALAEIEGAAPEPDQTFRHRPVADQGGAEFVGRPRQGLDRIGRNAQHGRTGSRRPARSEGGSGSGDAARCGAGAAGRSTEPAIPRQRSRAARASSGGEGVSPFWSSATQASIRSSARSTAAPVLRSRAAEPAMIRSNKVSSRWATASTAGRSTARDAPFRLWARRKMSFQSGDRPSPPESAPRIASRCSRYSMAKASRSCCRISTAGGRFSAGIGRPAPSAPGRAR